MITILDRLPSTAALLLAGLYLYSSPAHAQNATWIGQTSDWNTPTNWTGTPPTPPTVPTGTATFDATGITKSLTFSQGTTVGTLQVDAPGYSFTDSNPFGVFINGSGVVSTLANAPTINVNETAGFAFVGMSSAGFATINSGIAGQNSITDPDGFTGGFVFFRGSSTAANAKITSFFASNIEFQDTSKAGNATITAAENGGSIFFENTSSADHATITMLPGSAELSFSPGFFGGGTATAGNATITNSARTNFFQGSSAGNATIITDVGGVTSFFGESTGGNAAFITNAGGIVDISGLGTFPDGGGGPNVPGMTAGSIEGAGTYNLGSKELTVGSNNLSTEVSGLIEGNGGSLTKVGTGTLTLSGINTYTGPTNVNGGELLVRDPGSIAGSVDVHSGGALGGTGTIHGPVTIQAGGILTPGVGNTPGTLTVGPLTLNPGSILNYKYGIPGGINDLVIVNGNLTLAGTLNVTNLGGFGAGVYRVFDYSGSLTNNTLNLGSLPSGFGFSVDTAHANQVNLVVSGGLPTQFWDGSNTTPGSIAFGRGGNGTWNNVRTNTNWTTQDGTHNAAWGNGFAIFAGTAGTVTLGDDIHFTGMQFLTDGYVILAPGSQKLLAAPDTIIRVDAGLKATVSAPIADDSSGPARLTKTDAGALILSGDNTYTGGTIISDGTLQLGNGGTTGSIVGNVTDNGTLAFNRSNTVNFPGVISGSGAVTQLGPGTVILTANNSYSGGTNLDGGILAVNSDSNLGTGPLSFNGGTLEALAAGGGITSSKAVTLNAGAGTFLADAGTTSTLSGVISGVGSLTKDGLGTLTLTGTNTYSGGTTISAGTLQVGNGGTAGSITGNVIDNGTLAFNRSDSVTFDRVISGTGNVVKLGTGRLTLTEANTYTGTTTVNGGSLIVDGSIASVQTLVNPDGLFGGTGFLRNLVNSGIVSPGDSLGTLHVSGDYTQNPNGTLRIEVAGTAPGQFDVLAVGGHASLAGTLQPIRLGNFQLQVGDKLTFLTAGRGVSGTFSTIQNPFLSNTIVKVQITVLPNAVQLVGTQGSFTEAACNPNSLAVAKALDSAVGDPRAAGLINFLDNQPINQLCNDFTLIAPEQLASIFNIGVSLANVQTANLERRMEDIRAGSTGFSAAGFTMNGSTPNFSGLGGPTGAEGKAGPSVLAPIPENRWGVFVTGLGEFTHVDSTDVARGFDLQTGGFTLGVDYRVCPYFAVGLIAGYAHTNADLANGGNLDVNSGKFGLYATAFSGGFYLDTAVTGGISGYDTHRAALLGTASGSTNGGDLNVLVNGGYDWKKGNLSIGPTASFQYTYVSFDGFTESGSLAPLKINDQHVDSIRTAFGMKTSYDWKVGSVLVRPELRVGWQHEYGNSAYSIAASFANGAGSSFTVTSPKIGRDSLLLGAGFAVLWSDRISTYIYYDGELGRTNYQSNNVSAGVRVTF